jgi:glycosyltransferase involved in cell wall biosynthesis
MKNIRLAWDNSFARRNLTGTGVYAAQLLARLRAVNGLEIHSFEGWIAANPPGVLRGVRTLANLVWMRTSLPAALRKGGFDLLHSPAYLAPTNAPCPVVVTMHDVAYLHHPEGFAWRWVRLMKSVMPAVTASAAAIVCGSESAKRDIAGAYSVPASRIHVVPYGVDHERFRPDTPLDRDWAQRMKIPPGYVLHVGELSHRKNIPTLVRAVAHLRSKGRWGNRRLVLAGDKAPGMKGADDIQRTIKQLGMEGDVALTGRVPSEHLPGLYANAALLVMPSFYEGFGFPVAEAMASGTPVVCSNASSLPEVAGDAALLADPHKPEEFAERIAEVLDNATLAARLREKGLGRAKLFDWRRNAEGTYRVYESVLRHESQQPQDPRSQLT